MYIRESLKLLCLWATIEDDNRFAQQIELLQQLFYMRL